MTGTALVRPRRAVTAQVRSLVPDLSGPPWAKRSVGQQKQSFRVNVCKLSFSSLRDLTQISLYWVLLGSSSQTSHVPFFFCGCVLVCFNSTGRGVCKEALIPRGASVPSLPFSSNATFHSPLPWPLLMRVMPNQVRSKKTLESSLVSSVLEQIQCQVLIRLGRYQLAICLQNLICSTGVAAHGLSISVRETSSVIRGILACSTTRILQLVDMSCAGYIARK